MPVAVVDMRENGFRAAVNGEDGLQVPAPEDLADGYDAHFGDLDVVAVQ